MIEVVAASRRRSRLTPRPPPLRGRFSADASTAAAARPLLGYRLDGLGAPRSAAPAASLGAPRLLFTKSDRGSERMWGVVKGSEGVVKG